MRGRWASYALCADDLIHQQVLSDIREVGGPGFVIEGVPGKGTPRLIYIHVLPVLPGSFMFLHSQC